jgi:hypothetical protein
MLFGIYENCLNNLSKIFFLKQGYQQQYVSILSKSLEQPMKVQLQLQLSPHILSSFQHKNYKTKGTKFKVSIQIFLQIAQHWVEFPILSWITNEILMKNILGNL